MTQKTEKQSTRLSWNCHGPELFIALLLIVSTLVVYWPVRNHGFIHYDDLVYVTHNPHVRAGLTPRGVVKAFTATRASNWHPLTWLSHMLDIELYGLNPGGHHLTNVLLHIANALLLFFVLKRMTGALWQSSFVAALFALHPLHVESVAWVAERKDVLSTFFWMLTMWAYVRYAKALTPNSFALSGSALTQSSPSRWTSPSPHPSPTRGEGKQINDYLLVLVLFLLGLMSKPMLVTMPFVLLLLDYWPLGRFQPDQWKSQALPLIREKIPLFVLSAASSVVTYFAQQSGGAVQPTDIFPFKMRIANAFVSYVSYLGKMICPQGLALHYPYPKTVPFWQVAGSALLLISITLGVIRLGRRYPYLPVGWFWYIGTLVPVIGLVQVGAQSMADRYTYVPLIGLFIMIAMAVPDLLSRWPRRRMMLATSVCVALMVLLLIARIQVSYWQNSIRLFEHTLAVTTKNDYFHNMMGMALALQGRPQEGMPHFTEALRINPRYLDPQNNLGLVLERLGRVEEAKANYVEVLRKDPNNAEAHNNLGNVLSDQGKFEEAIFHLTEAVRIKPDYGGAHNKLGIVLARQGRLQEATAHYIEALRIDPNDAEAHNNLGIALANQEKPQEAMAHYLEALRIKPDYAETESNLGVAVARQGKVQEAMVHFQKAIRMDPQYEKAYHNLGVALSGQGKNREAIANYTEALRIKPTFVEARFSLCLAYAAIGDRTAALEQSKILGTINPDLANRLFGEISK